MPATPDLDKMCSFASPASAKVPVAFPSHCDIASVCLEKVSEDVMPA
jgi:hypothetical protein